MLEHCRSETNLGRARFGRRAHARNLDFGGGANRHPELRRTTRDEPDYGKLMRGRIAILDKHGLKLADIQQTIAELRPLEGALEFLRQLRALTQVIILSDTFEEFAQPLMRQLEWPTIFCNRLVVESGRIAGHQMRQDHPKRHSVRALRGLNYRVIAAGDSYNDTAMLLEADVQLFLPRSGRPSGNNFPSFPQSRPTPI